MLEGCTRMERVNFKRLSPKISSYSSCSSSPMVFLRRLWLETSYLRGWVHVRNVRFEKHVTIRFTTDGWRSWKDAPCRYRRSIDSSVDEFEFQLDFDSEFTECYRRLRGGCMESFLEDSLVSDCTSVASVASVEFAIRYVAGDTGMTATTTEEWDSNQGRNYVVQLQYRYWLRRECDESVTSLSDDSLTMEFPPSPCPIPARAPSQFDFIQPQYLTSHPLHYQQHSLRLTGSDHPHDHDQRSSLYSTPPDYHRLFCTPTPSELPNLVLA